MTIRSLLVAALFFASLPMEAHVGDHPSVHDTVANIIERMRGTLNPDDLRKLNSEKVEQFLTPEERHILGTEHVSFQVNVPVLVSVITSSATREVPFWLAEKGFEKKPLNWKERDSELTRWDKKFDAGWVGLGVNSIRGSGVHYLVLLTPIEKGAQIEVTDLYPGQLRIANLANGVQPFVDREETLKSVPPDLEGAVLVQTQHRQRDDARMTDVFRWTEHPSADRPDQIVLTWSADPKTSQTIQWRTSPKMKRAVVIYKKKSLLSQLTGDRVKSEEVRGKTEVLETPQLIKDQVVHRHTATLTGLEPGTTYVYTVGDGSKAGWSEPAEFTTAPAETKPFSFIYMGDAQNGLDRWGTLLRNAYRERPDAAFYIMAGDLVNRGADRDDWDSFFYNAAGVFDRRQLVPVLGNHEYQGGNPNLYLTLFHLMENGPSTVGPERAYAFEYSNTLFVILDSNLDPELQSEWLEEQLSTTKATWKFVVYHHPAYSSGKGRDNKKVRNIWTPIFDKYHVDMALQGHDHAYLRTYPMHDQKRVKSPAEGTVYVVSVSGTKMYDQDPRDYTEFGMTNVSTYQVLDIQISGDRMVYRAYDIDGKLRDELVIQK